MTKSMWLAPLAATALMLGGCEETDVDPSSDAQATKTSDKTLSAAIAGDDGLTDFNAAIRDADLASVFDGASPYTILAPSDEAFAELGDRAVQLTPDGDTAPLVALLRNHIVTGYLRPEDLRTAIVGEADGTVEMSTVGSDPVTFAMDGDTIVARGPDGSEARLLIDRAVEASNGVVIPVDGILRELPATASADGD